MIDDRAVLATIVISVGLAVWQLRTRGARGGRLFAASWMAFFGIALIVMMGAHSLDIVVHGLARGTRITGEPWRYDFHMYALHLLGGVLIWQGGNALRVTPALAAGSAERGVALRPVVITLFVVAPLIPVQPFFGTILTTLSAITAAIAIRWTRN